MGVVLNTPAQAAGMHPPLRDTARQWLAQGRPAVLVEVSAAQGSVPRGAGTRMLVADGTFAGTIGGGHLELKAIDEARSLLMLSSASGEGSTGDEAAAAAAAPATHVTIPLKRHYPLGPALGQCCGGAVTLRFERLTAAHVAGWPAVPPLFHLQLYGAGHVGRAIARLLATLPVSVDWIDQRDDEFPATLLDGGWPPHIRRIVVDDGAVEAEVSSAPPGTFFLVLTHRHDLDLAITEAILRRASSAGFGFLGLIGSRTKRQRFVHRFEALGIPPATIARMTCPIGITGIGGKEPEVIAVAAVAQLLLQATAG